MRAMRKYFSTSQGAGRSAVFGPIEFLVYSLRFPIRKRLLLSRRSRPCQTARCRLPQPDLLKKTREFSRAQAPTIDERHLKGQVRRREAQLRQPSQQWLEQPLSRIGVTPLLRVTSAPAGLPGEG